LIKPDLQNGYTPDFLLTVRRMRLSAKGFSVKLAISQSRAASDDVDKKCRFIQGDKRDERREE